MPAFDLDYCIHLILDALEYAELDRYGIQEARRLVNNDLRPAIEQHISERIQQAISAEQQKPELGEVYA